MQAILDQIADWLKGMLVDGIMNNLTGMFDAVNQQVSDVASQVGNTPQNFSPGVFSMIRVYGVRHQWSVRPDPVVQSNWA